MCNERIYIEEPKKKRMHTRNDELKVVSLKEKKREREKKI